MSEFVRAKKSYGQNFLNNDNILEQIASLCGDGNRLVIEIGPGTGALTKKLSEKYALVRSVELDTSLKNVLEENLSECSNVEILYEDFLKSDIKEIIGDWTGKVSVCANIPYYITAQIVEKLMDSSKHFENVSLLVQKEVADKLCAETGSGDAVPLTYKVRYYSSIRKCISVAPGNFTPPPKVYSSVVKMDIKREESNPDFEKKYVRDIGLIVKPGDKIVPFTGANNSLGTLFLQFRNRMEADHALSQINRYITICLDA